MSSTKELEEYTKFLRNAAPKEFNSFYGAFAKYTETAMESLLFVSGGDISRVQGAAQQCVNILRMLEKVKNG